MAAVMEHMSDADYFALPDMNHSSLRWLIDDTPAHYRWRRDHPLDMEPTPAMEFGTAVHSLVLGGPGIVPIDAEDWRTKAAKDARAAVRADGGVALLTDDFQRAQNMADAVRAHPVAAKLLSTADHTEVVIRWEERGVPCKAKLDLIAGRFGADLKTTDNAHPQAFGRSVAKYGYHTAQAFYTAAMKAAGIVDPRFVFIAVEKQPPHLVSALVLDDYAVSLARQTVNAALELYKTCAETDTWPGYGDALQPVQLPRWAEIEMESA